MEVGQKIPEGLFLSTDPDVQSFADVGKKNIVLYFYPKDNTPGCTIESKAFRDMVNEFAALDTQIIGVSRDSLASHEKFIQKHNLPFPLIADEDEKLCQAFGVLGEKSFFGKTIKGIIRSTFLIDKNRIVKQIWRKVKIKDHVAEVKEALCQLAEKS